MKTLLNLVVALKNLTPRRQVAKTPRTKAFLSLGVLAPWRLGVIPKSLTTYLGLLMVCVIAGLIGACATSQRTGLTTGGIHEMTQGQREFGVDLRGGGGESRQGDTPLAIARPGEDIWIIVKPPAQDPAVAQDNTDVAPGCGAMLAISPIARQNNSLRLPRRNENPPALIPLPLKHTDVRASIAGYIASVKVTQQFHNPFAEKIEAVYQFPLPQDAAVSEFIMTVGTPDNPRRIRGIVREKEEAEQIYRQARAQGFNASLLTQVRPNIFEQKVANIEPGQQIDIEITYFNTLSYADGWYTFVFPMVVGPRFNPTYSDDPVRALPRGAHAGQQQNGTDITYLRPEERSGHDFALTLDIDAGVSIEEARCITHVVEAGSVENNKLHVELSDSDTIPNKDFVFAFRVAGAQMKSGLVTHTDAEGNNYFTLMIYPPADLDALSRQPMEMVFVLDCSGSMSGEPMTQAKTAIRRALRHLGPDDTFQIIRFSNDASALGPRPLLATPANIREGLRYVDSLSGGGGTQMIEGIKASLDFPHDDSRFRVVTFLTDGFIGNESHILREINDRLGEARIFSFGVGSSPNRYLMNRMAKAGRGAAAYLLPGDSANDVMDLYFNRISHPAMTDVAIDFGTMRVEEIYPANAPDLIVGRPVIVTGRFQGDLSNIQISGSAGRQDVSITLDAMNDSTTHPALAQVWARRKIADLMDQMRFPENRQNAEQNQLQQAVLDTALGYQLMSQYTAFIAVDASRITDGDHGTTVPQALPMPEGVQYDTTVGEE